MIIISLYQILWTSNTLRHLEEPICASGSYNAHSSFLYQTVSLVKCENIEIHNQKSSSTCLNKDNRKAELISKTKRDGKLVFMFVL